MHAGLQLKDSAHYRDTDKIDIKIAKGHGAKAMKHSTDIFEMSEVF